MATVNRAAEQASPVLTSANWRTIVSSAARATGDTETWDWEQAESQGLVVVIDVTALTAGASLVFTIQGVDPVSGATWDILASAAVVATGTTVLKVHPALTASANAVAKDVVPARVRVKVVPADTKSVTYTIGATHTG